MSPRANNVITSSNPHNQGPSQNQFGHEYEVIRASIQGALDNDSPAISEDEPIPVSKEGDLSATPNQLQSNTLADLGETANGSTVRPTPEQILLLAEGYSYQYDHSELPVETAQAEVYNGSQTTPKLSRSTVTPGHPCSPQEKSLNSFTPSPGTLPALERTLALAEGYSDMYYSDGTT